MLRIKHFITVAALFTAMMFAAVCAYAEEKSYVAPNGYKAVISDEAELFTPEEEEKLMERLKTALEYGGAAIVTVSVNSLSAEDYAKNAYRGYFGKDSGTLFLIDMDNRYLQFFSDGSNHDVLTRSKTNEISDNVYTHASRGDYFKCADMAFEQAVTVLSGGKITTPMRYVTNAIFAVGLVLMVNIWVVVSQRRKPDPSLIVDTMQQTNRGGVKNVFSKMTRQTRSRVESSSGSGGGGGGFSGGGGGGGSSGGGGGHSF